MQQQQHIECVHIVACLSAMTKFENVEYCGYLEPILVVWCIFQNVLNVWHHKVDMIALVIGISPFLSSFCDQHGEKTSAGSRITRSTYLQCSAFWSPFLFVLFYFCLVQLISTFNFTSQDKILQQMAKVTATVLSMLQFAAFFVMSVILNYRPGSA